MSVLTFGTNVNASTQIPTPASITELFGEIALNSNISVIGFTDSVNVDFVD